jgi:hypothetical protein
LQSTARKVRPPPNRQGATARADRLCLEHETGAVGPHRSTDWRAVFDHPTVHPDDARGAPRLELDKAAEARRLFVNEQIGAGAIAQRLNVGVLSVFDALEPLAQARAEDDDEIPYPNHLLLDRDADPACPAPVVLEDGAVYMVGSQPPRSDNCLRRHVLECLDCENRRRHGDTIPAPDGARDPEANVEGQIPWPPGYARMQTPAGCENPACRTCKTIYTPTRAAAAAVRVTQGIAHHEHDGQEIAVRHVVLSPPEDDEDNPRTRDEVTALFDRARAMLERKGALGWVLALHPWRGKPPDWRDGEPRWHLHAIASFPANPDGTPPEKLGGRTCCRHRAVYTDDGPSPDETCCEGACSDPSCPHHRAQQARQRRQQASGRLGAARRHGDPQAEADARQQLAQAQQGLARAEQHRCDRGWVFRVVTDGPDDNGPPLDVRQGLVELEKGAHTGAQVDEGVHELLRYELDHAGVVVDGDEQVKAHVLRYGGAWSYNRLELHGDGKAAVDHLMDDEDHGPSCPGCGGRNLEAITHPETRAEIDRRLRDEQDRARLEACWMIARAVLEDGPDPDENPDDDRPPPEVPR